MDAKGRLAVPTRHREVLQALCGGALTITRSPDHCLILFPRPEWEAFRERIAAWPMSAMAWKRMYLGNAMDLEMDGAGRILIPPELREAVKLDKQISLIGMGSHFEIWDAARHKSNEDDLGPLPDSLKDFSY